MDRRARRLTDDHRVVSLGIDPAPEEVPPSLPTSRLHSVAVFCTALFGISAIVWALAFVTVNWAGSSRRAVIAGVLFSIVGFLASVAITIFSAARDTYARRPPH